MVVAGDNRNLHPLPFSHLLFFLFACQTPREMPFFLSQLSLTAKDKEEVTQGEKVLKKNANSFNSGNMKPSPCWLDF